MASFLIGRGAVPEIHHAVRLEMVDEVRRMLAADPDSIHARGGDGQLPLHFAQTVEMAELLLNHGADVNARDVDHESTRGAVDGARPAGGRAFPGRSAAAPSRHPDGGGARRPRTHARGCSTRIRSRSAPSCRTNTSRCGIARAGGTIYIWTLGADKTAHEVAREFGHEDVLTR